MVAALLRRRVTNVLGALNLPPNVIRACKELSSWMAIISDRAKYISKTLNINIVPSATTRQTTTKPILTQSWRFESSSKFVNILLAALNVHFLQFGHSNVLPKTMGNSVARICVMTVKHGKGKFTNTKSEAFKTNCYHH